MSELASLTGKIIFIIMHRLGLLASEWVELGSTWTTVLSDMDRICELTTFFNIFYVKRGDGL